MKLSGYQIDVIESSIECALGGGFFNDKHKVIAETLLESLTEDVEELE